MSEGDRLVELLDENERLRKEVIKRGAIIREAMGWIAEPRDRTSPRVALLRRMRECADLAAIEVGAR